MSDEDLIGYILDLLDPDDRATVAARLASDPKAAARLERLRSAAAPLLTTVAVERDSPPAPRPGLAVRAIARVAEYVVEHEPRPVEREHEVGESAAPTVAAFLQGFGDAPPAEVDFGPGTRAKRPGPGPAPPPTDGPEPRTGGRFRADLLVAAGIAILGIGLVLSGIAKARHQSRVYACQNTLRTLHTGLAGYADTDAQHRYPQIGGDAHPTAETFVTSLTDLGHLPTGFVPGCPATADRTPYTYTLGFRGPNGELLGLRRPDGTTTAASEYDLMPISADFPAASAAPGGSRVSPHGGSMNVLFVGGNVRLTTSPNVGPRGDDIYRNVFGHVAAGVNGNDAVLGGPGTRP